MPRIQRKFDNYGMTQSGVFSLGWWLVVIDKTEHPSITEIRVRSGRQHHQTKIVIEYLVREGYITEGTAKNESGRRWATKYVLTDKAKPIALDFIEDHPQYKFNSSDLLIENEQAKESETDYNGPVHKVPEIEIPKPSIPEVKKSYIPPPDTTKKPEPVDAEMQPETRDSLDAEFLPETIVDDEPAGEVAVVNSFVEPNTNEETEEDDPTQSPQIQINDNDQDENTTSKESLDVVENSDESTSTDNENDIDKLQTVPPITIAVPISKKDLQRKLAYAKADLKRYDVLHQTAHRIFAPKNPLEQLNVPTERQKLLGEIVYHETLIRELPE